MDNFTNERSGEIARLRWMALNEALENFAFYMKQQAPDAGCVAMKLPDEWRNQSYQTAGKHRKEFCTNSMSTSYIILSSLYHHYIIYIYHIITYHHISNYCWYSLERKAGLSLTADFVAQNH